MNLKRNRFYYLVGTVVVIISGLASRKFQSYLPDFINTFLGDALWALMIYLIVAALFKNRKRTIIAILSLMFCYLIEISQLYHAPWIDSIRRTTLGGLVLGFGFLWSDIIAYTLGIVTGIIIEYLIFSYLKRKNIR